MNTSNRSECSEVFQDRELVEAVLQKTDETRRLSESVGSRLSSLVLTHPSLRSTDNLSRPASIYSKQSVTLSQCPDRLSDVVTDFPAKTDNAQYEQLKVNLLVMSLLCVCSLLLGYLALQLLLSIAAQQTTTQQTITMSQNSLVVANLTRTTITEVATALSTFVVALNLTCLLVCSLQSLIVVKLLKVNLGDERAIKFLRECSSGRFVATHGFFVSIPIFYVALILYIVLQFTSAAAITATVVLSVCSVYCVISILQNSYHWKIEKSRAIAGLPVFDCSSPKPGAKTLGGTVELSTLV